MDSKKITCVIVLGLAVVAGCRSGGASEEKHEKISLTALPQPVRAGFEKAYPGVTIREVEKETYPDGTVHYEIGFVGADGKEQDVELNADGDVLDDH